MPNVIAALVISVGSWIAVPGGSWSPSATSIAEARLELEPFVSRQAAAQHKRLADWSKYTFQYQGQEQAGRRVVLVNAFCSKPPDKAATHLLMVEDGGPCFFQAYWDPAQKIYISVMFNGDA
jgi:hypothetical protein